MTGTFASDPRDDLLITAAWEEMSERLRSAVRGLDAPTVVRDALRAVIDLHVAWERREQVFDEAGWSHDAVLGVGCRMCDHRPSLAVVGEKVWCSTLEALRVSLLENGTNLHVIPADQADQAAAWYRGYHDARTNIERFEAWQAAGGISHSPGPDLLLCPFVAPSVEEETDE